MRKIRGRQSRTARKALTAVGVAGFIASASLFALSGTAAATTTASKCTGSVSGPMGDSLRLKSESVKSEVIEAVRGGIDLPPLHKSHKTRVREAYEEGKIKAISLPSIPKSAGGKVSGSQIAEATLKRLESVEELEDIAHDGTNRRNIREIIGSECGLTVKASNYSPPRTSSPSAPSVGDGAQPSAGSSAGSPSGTSGKRPSSSGVPGTSVDPEDLEYGSGSSRAPRRDYGDVPFVVPGSSGDDKRQSMTQFKTPGLASDFDTLGSNKRDGADVDNAGNAEAIAADGQDQSVQLPILLAVVALAGVAAALVRTWVLRRV